MSKSEKLGSMYVDIVAKTATIEAEMKRLTKKIEGDAEKAGKGYSNMFNKGMQLAGGFIGLQAAINFGKKIIDTASQFEQLKTRLTSLYGSAERATEVFDHFKKVAFTTPYTLKGVVEAGATIKSFGMDAEKSIKPVADLAAYMGLDVVEAASAVGRAFAGGVGAADVLRQRGVLNLIKSFKGIDDLTKLTLPQFREALNDAMVSPTLGIAGSTDRLSKTWAGAFSNMMDSLDKFANMIGSKLMPMFSPIIKTVMNLVDSFTKEEDAVAAVTRKGQEQIAKFNVLANRYEILAQKTKLASDEKKILTETINEMQRLYPNYFKNIDLEKGKFEDSQKAIDKARGSLEQYLEAQIKFALAQKNMDELVKVSEELYKAQKALIDLQAKPGYKVKEGDDAILNHEARLKTGMETILNGQIKIYGDKKKKLTDLIADYKTQAEAIMGQILPPSTILKTGGTGTTGGGSTDKSVYDRGRYFQTQDLADELTPSMEIQPIGEGRIGSVQEIAKPELLVETNLEMEAMVAYTDALNSGFENAGSSLASSMGQAVTVFKTANSLLQQYINLLVQSVVQSIALAAITKFITTPVLGFLGLGATPVPGAANGGEFVGTSSGVKKMANGGSFTVPSGFNNDSYPMFVRSEEHTSELQSR